jgi:hypothetical protein
MAISNPRAATTSLWGVVSTAAGAAGGAFTATTRSITLLDNYVQEALARQEYRQAAERITFQDSLADELGQLEAERKITVVEFCGRSEQHAALFTESRSKIAAAIAAVDARKSSSTP